MTRATKPTIHHSSPIPVRALLAVAGTALSLALLVSFRTPEGLSLPNGGRGAVPPSVNPSATAGPVATGGGRIAQATPRPTIAAPAPTAIGRSSGAPPNAAATLPPVATQIPVATPGAAATGDATGTSERTPFGNVQVEVKVAAGKIVDVIAVQLPSDRRRSAQISSYVEPILHQEALQAQSAQIDLISGATWTSGAYQASLQAALDQLAHG